MKTGIYWQDPKYAVGRDFILDPSLVLYLPLYEVDGASIMSKDAYGHLCTVTGALWTPRGRSFDGVDDRIDCGNPNALQITKYITIELWLRHILTVFAHPVNKDDGTNRCYGLFLDSTGFIIWFIWVGNIQSSVQTPSLLAPNIWYHVAATYDGERGTVYLNGREDVSVPWSGNIDNDPANFIIGQYNGSRYFKGAIGEVRIYNRALTPPEIQHNYLTTKWRYQ